MTDTSSVAFTTHSHSTYPPVTAPALESPALNGSLSDSVPAEEDEPYTIKCICGFQDDDGNTVFCERCETWQHIDCYYHGRDVPEVHNCVDCEPRTLDARRATDRQRQRRLRELDNGGDRKTKRSGSKSHKKKVKEVATEPTINGWPQHQRNGSASVGRDQPPPAKRPKTNHRASNSVHTTPVLPPDVRKRAGSTSSPAKSPLLSHHSTIPLYTQDFLTLYDRDEGNTNMETSVYDNLSLAGELAQWRQDSAALARVTSGKQPQDVFVYLDNPDELINTPRVTKQSKTDHNVSWEGRHPRWQYLRLEDFARKDEIVGEVKGKIGALRDYSNDPQNNWQQSRHPEPFVFFHPQLPIYIDSRKEGTEFRYVRRSCRPNLTMKTFITNDHEYHFCFVATQDIPPGTELTAMWYMDPGLFSRNAANKSLIKEEDDTIVSGMNRNDWASRVLANFGDCACSGPDQCLLASLDHRQRPPTASTKAAKRKRTKSKAGVSPTSTGHATNSRAGSESVKNQDDDEALETRSATGSSRGQPKSRDLTPVSANQETFVKGVLTSAREQRKLAAVESRFQMLEHDQPTDKKKKKRSSTGSTTNPAKGHTNNMSTGQSTRTYTDAGTSRNQSGSPPLKPSHRKVSNHAIRKTSQANSPLNPSSSVKLQYVDAGVQTDPEEEPASGPKPYKPTGFMTLSQRLFKRCHDDRRKLQEEQSKSPSTPSSPSFSMLPPRSPVSVSSQLPEPENLLSAKANQTSVEERLSGDSEMKDVPFSSDAVSPLTEVPIKEVPSTEESNTTEPVPKPLPPSWPSTAAHSATFVRPGAPNGFRATGLRVELPNDSVNSLDETASDPPEVVGPDNSISHSPGSVNHLAPPTSLLPLPNLQTMAAPSPVKKKLSLGDYMSRRNNLTTPTTEKSENSLLPATILSSSPTAPTEELMTKPSEGIIEEAKARGGLQGSAIEEIPAKESSADAPSAPQEAADTPMPDASAAPAESVTS